MFNYSYDKSNLIVNMMCIVISVITHKLLWKIELLVQIEQLHKKLSKQSISIYQ